MSALLDAVVSYEPVVSGVSVPLLSNIIIVLSGTDYDTTSLEEGFFLEGPTGDQFYGPGLIPLEYPEGIPAEDVQDILDTAADLTTIVDSTVTVTTGVNTTITLDPTYPLQASVEYNVNLTDVLDAAEDTISGFVTWSFTTGTGSIEELPEDISTSVLATSIQASSAILSAAPLKILKTTPADHSVQNSPNLEEIEIEFNKAIDATSIDSASIKIEGLPVTDHPSSDVSSSGDLYRGVTVDGAVVTLKI